MAYPRLARELLRDASLELARLRRIRGASHKTWRRIARARARLAFAAALLAAAPVAEPAAAGTPLFRHGLTPLQEVSVYNAPDFADIDGDGDHDAFVGSLYGDTVLFRNTGTASAPAFADPSTNPFGLTSVDSLASPAFADIDADGDFDALVGTGFGFTLFFANTGTARAPAFAAPSTNPFGLTSVGWEPDFADIDADGDLDVFFGSSSGAIVFARNTGTVTNPAFASASTNPFGLVSAQTYSAPAFADIDGDGDLDAFVGEYDGRTLFFRNSGTANAPAFAAPSYSPFGLPQLFLRASPTFQDLDGDGDLDAYIGNYASFGCENTGTASTPAFSCAGNPFGLAAPTGFGPPPFSSAPDLADLDGDGDLDAFVGQREGVAFLQNTGTVLAPAFSPTSIGGPQSVVRYGSSAFADIDGDGDLDSFVGDRYGDTRFYRNTGTIAAPAFASASTNPFGLADVGDFASPTFADVDGDGDVDAFVGNASGDTLFFENTGTAVAPALAAPSTNAFGLANVGYHAAPRFTDLDGDGDLDALVGAGEGSVVLFSNTGTAAAPAFAAPSADAFGFTGVGSLAAPTFGDIDGDGDLDAFVGALFGGVFFFENVAIDPEACADGLDNDGDGRIDAGNDPGCASASDTSELSALQCDNGVDDDGDGKIDWRADGSGDPECMAPRGDREAPVPPDLHCGLGPELFLVGSLLAWARRRSRRP